MKKKLPEKLQNLHCNLSQCQPSFLHITNKKFHWKRLSFDTFDESLLQKKTFVDETAFAENLNFKTLFVFATNIFFAIKMRDKMRRGGTVCRCLKVIHNLKKIAPFASHLRLPLNFKHNHYGHGYVNRMCTRKC